MISEMKICLLFGVTEAAAAIGGWPSNQMQYDQSTHGLGILKLYFN